MIKTIISILVIGLLLWGGYAVWSSWDNYDTQKDIEQKQNAAMQNMNEQTLPGMPNGLEPSYAQAKAGGTASLGKWLKVNGPGVQDPRRAWIEMDYMILIAHEDTAEAKRIFADVKARTPTNSLVYPRVKLLEKTYE